jgi:arachidonate 15-lipoxygenase
MEASVLSLPQNDGYFEQIKRKIENEIAQTFYTYEAVAGLPMPTASTSAVLRSAVLPRGLQWGIDQGINNFRLNAELAEFDEKWKSKGSPKRFAVINDFADFFITSDKSRVADERFAPFDKPRVVDNWNTDASFANQRVAGLNPMALNRVTSDGSGVGLDWTGLRAKLSAQLVDAMTSEFPTGIADAIAAKRLYAADYVDLQKAGVTGKECAGAQAGRVLMAPIGLFFSPPSGNGLSPVGIQLDQPATSPWATPRSSSGTTWNAAKVYYQAADVSLNQIVNHLGMTHLIQSSFALATLRQLATVHPLFALLTPHYVGLLPINDLGGRTLLNQGGIVDQILEPGLEGGLRLIQAAYRRWQQFFDLDPDADLAQRGCDDTSALPYFPYRDDGKLIWGLIGDYVKDYLQLFYGDPKTDPQRTAQAVQQDYELQAWAQELAHASPEGGNVPAFPSPIQDFDTLHRVVRLLIWIAGPRHASVNFPQTEYTAFVPNQPTAIYLLPDAVSNNFILDMMPPVEKSRTQFQISYQLAGLYFDQMLDYSSNFDGGGIDGRAKEIVASYKEKLDTAITVEINGRNQERQRLGLLPYPYFLPKNIPNGTSV